MSKDKASRVGRLKALLGEVEPTNANLWLTVYSDMMTNLMLFFVGMFTLSLLGQDYVKRATEAFDDALKGEKVSEIKVEVPKIESLTEYIETLKESQKNVEVIQHGEGVRLRLPEPVLFDLGKADLKPTATQVLHEIAQGLHNLHHAVVVEGHTDNIPIKRSGRFKSNWELSEARAESVVDYLINVEKIPPDRLAVAGYGEHWPFVSNDTDVDRALNRRIELLLILDEKEPS